MPLAPAGRQKPRRVVARTIGLAGSAFAAAALLAWNPTPTTGWNQGAAEGTLWQLLNGARVNNGMAPLQQHGTLWSLAQWRSADMIQRDYFSHTIAGTGCQVYCYYDSNGLSYVWGGENIGWNSGLSDDYSPVRVHEKFMGSPGHRANVLNAAFTHGGVGAYAADNVMFQGYVQNPRMYTELFLQAPSAPAPPPPPPSTAPAPAPAPPPPSSGGGGGGGYAPRPAAPAPAAAAPEPEPVEMAVAAPARPSAGAEADGTFTVVAPARFGGDLMARLAADDALGVPRGNASPDAVRAVAEAAKPELRVEAAPEPDPNFLESVFGALLGFFFG